MATEPPAPAATVVRTYSGTGPNGSPTGVQLSPFGDVQIIGRIWPKIAAPLPFHAEPPATKPPAAVIATLSTLPYANGAALIADGIHVVPSADVQTAGTGSGSTPAEVG